MSDLVKRLNRIAEDYAPFPWARYVNEAADALERLAERCEAYKGQVEAGAAKIAALERRSLEKKEHADSP